MKKGTSTDSKPKRPKVTAVAETAGDPIDIDRWVEGYVRTVLELEGVCPAVAPAPAASVGSAS